MDRTDFQRALLMMQAEYLEMPGLKVTLWQATRLWNLPADVCRTALNALVVAGFLAETRDGAFVRGSLPAQIATLDPFTWMVRPTRATSADRPSSAT